jgi:hypothetical protein
MLSKSHLGVTQIFLPSNDYNTSGSTMYYPKQTPTQLRGHRERAPYQAHHERMNGKWS